MAVLLVQSPVTGFCLKESTGILKCLSHMNHIQKINVPYYIIV